VDDRANRLADRHLDALDDRCILQRKTRRFTRSADTRIQADEFDLYRSYVGL
jgi:hypothetical protein